MPNQNSMHILVVEDDPSLRQNLVQGLREEGYQVDSCSDGEEGLYHLAEFDYSAAILDIMLPKIGGWDILEKIRPKNTTPILVLTARDSVQDRVRGLDSGADDYLVKPFHLAELYSRLRALIRRASGNASSSIEVDGISLDSHKRLATLDGQHLPLTNVEYSILEALLSQRGRLVTRRFLYDNIFDETGDSISDSLYVHVCRLRKKLGKDLIKTRPGLGYIVESE